MPTLSRARPFHGRPPRIQVRVNVAPGGAEVTVAGEVRQGVRVHVRRPPRQASVPEGVERQPLDARPVTRLAVPLHQGGLLHVAALGGRGRGLIEAPDRAGPWPVERLNSTTARSWPH